MLKVRQSITHPKVNRISIHSEIYKWGIGGVKIFRICSTDSNATPGGETCKITSVRYKDADHERFSVFNLGLCHPVSGGIVSGGGDEPLDHSPFTLKTLISLSTLASYVELTLR